jgi:hypothetical protein
VTGTNTQNRAKVVLHLWGVEERDLVRARDLADRSVSAWGWDVVAVTERTGVPCPIPNGDRSAVNQGAEYGAAWAAYPASARAGL